MAVVQTPSKPSGARAPSTGRGYIERYTALTGATLTPGNPTVFSKELPLGEGWYKMNLRINEIFVVGTGTTPITEGELLFIKNIQLKTDRGEIVCNLPGRALYKIGAYKSQSPPAKDNIAASSSTYTVTLPIYLCEPRISNMLRITDTILNTARYNTVTLQVTLGTVSDLLTTPGTSSVTATLDIELERTFGPLPDRALPKYIQSYDFRPPIDASVGPLSIDIERSADMAIKRLFVFSCTGGTAGVPCSGQNSDAIQSVITIKDQNRFIDFQRIHAMVQRQNKNDQALEALLVGIEVYDYVQDGSIASALATAEKSVLQYTWTNQGGQAANNLVTLVEDMIRTMK